MRRVHAALALALLLASCASDLDPAVVENLPNGNARGNEWSGTWITNEAPSTCMGACGATSCGSSGSGPVSSLEQDDGHLIARDCCGVDLIGGVEADGRFDVGTTRPTSDGVPRAARLRGRLTRTTPHGVSAIEGTLAEHLTGMRDGVALDCIRVSSIRGYRPGS